MVHQLLSNPPRHTALSLTNNEYTALGGTMLDPAASVIHRSQVRDELTAWNQVSVALRLCDTYLVEDPSP